MATKKSSAKKAPARRRKTTVSRSDEPISRVDLVTFEFARGLIDVLGEDHYPYGEYLHHELAANAYDSDATEVTIVDEVAQLPARGRELLYTITVSDNGNGMDYEGLVEYFRVGQSSKPAQEGSERFKRPLIGRIGVGKVAILKVARRWRITTERHLGLDEPVRLTVLVDVDEWIHQRVPAFAVQYLEPTGRPGTEIVLENVHTRLRNDRILRHLQRLPLGDEFRVWRNGQLIPPRHWYGIRKVDIDEEVVWIEEGVEHRGRVRGEVWVRDPKDSPGYIDEPENEKDGLRREPAGIAVRVDRDTIVHEFFGRATHAHGINRIWGWVDVPWLPILGNRTDYQRDHPAAIAFQGTLKPIFDRVYLPLREEGKGKRKAASAARDSSAAKATSSSTGKPKPSGEALPVASRYGEGINRVLSDKPELAPVLRGEPHRSRGRPAKDRIYPVRPTGERKPFEPSQLGTDRAISEEQETVAMQRVIAGAIRRASAQPRRTVRPHEIGGIEANTKAGVKLEFQPLGPLEAPYRWDVEYEGDEDDLRLLINTDHKLLKACGRPGTAMHRLHCAWLVSLALAENRNPTAGGSFADLLEQMSYELYTEWETQRS